MPVRCHIWMLVFALMTARAPSLFAQSGQVSGTVRDAATGAPLRAVNVTLQRDTLVVAGTATDEAGRYSLAGVAPDVYTLLARFVGYRTVRAGVAVGARPIVLDLQMEAGVLDLDEVEVSAGAFQDPSDVNVSLTRITPRQAGRLAGGGEDVIGALQTLPGVLTAGDYAGQLIIRGGTPDQNLILLDDIEVFSPYQLSGVGSLINPALVRQVDLYTGAFPAAYGDRLSSVLAVQTREGRRDRQIGGRVGSNLLNVHLTLEGRTGLWDGSWLASGRRTYFGSFANTFARRIGIFNDIAFPAFSDAHLKLALRPAPAHHLRLTVLHSRDALDWIVEEDAFGEQRGAEDLLDGGNRVRNTAFGLAWTYVPASDAQVKVFANWYRNSGESSLAGGLVPRAGAAGPRVVTPLPPVFGRADTARFAYSQVYALEKAALAGQVVLRRGRHTFEAGGGVDVLENALDLGLELNAFGEQVFEAFAYTSQVVSALARSVDERKTYRRAQGYVQDKVALAGGRFYVQPSFRYDYYGVTRRGYLSPRLSLSAVLDTVTVVRVAAGRYVQSPGFEKLLDQDNLFNLARYRSLDSLQAEEALHLGAGFSRRFGQAWNVKVEGYWKRLDRLITQASRAAVRPVAVYNPSGAGGAGQAGRLNPTAYLVQEAEVFELTPEPVNDGSGRAYGLELFVEKRAAGADDAWSGWFSYAYARAEREQDVAGRVVRFPFDYDRRHTLNLTLGRRLSRHVDVGFTWRYGSGFPYTPAAGMDPLLALVDDPETNAVRGALLTDPATGLVRLVPEYGGAENVNAGRLPAYHRLDARVTYTTRWRGVSVEAYLDLINLYNRKNTLTYRYFVEVVEPPAGNLPTSLRPPPEPVLFREPVYMFPFIPSFGFGLAF